MKICFFENFHRGPYLVGFPNVVIMVQCSVPHHVLIVSALSFTNLFDLGLAYCELLFYNLPCKVKHKAKIGSVSILKLT